MFKNTIIIHNPRAGKGNGSKISNKLKKILEKKSINATIHAPDSFEKMDELYKLVKEENKVDSVIIIGGDGTVGVNVNSMKKCGLDLPIYAFGRGTANDFSKYVKTNVGYKKFAALFDEKNVRNCDIIKTGNEYAVSITCGGAFTNGVVDYNKKLKRIFGKIVYFIKGFFQALTMPSQRVKFNVDGVEFEETCYCFFIANTKNVGGIKNLASLASHSDGMLDLIIIKKCKFFQKIKTFNFLTRGKFHACKNVTYMHGRKFEVTPIPPVVHNFTKTDIDGNLGTDYPIKAEIAIDALKVISGNIKK